MTKITIGFNTFDFDSKNLLTDDRRGDKIVATYDINGGGNKYRNIHS